MAHENRTALEYPKSVKNALPERSEDQRQMYCQHAMKVDIPTHRHVFSIMISWNHNYNKVSWLPYKHSHIRYEVLCVRNRSGNPDGKFLVVPPGVEHTTYYSENAEMQIATTFQFYVRERTAVEGEMLYAPNDALEAFLKLDDMVEFPDTFGGVERIETISHELELLENACFDTVYAEFQLLMVQLARSLPGYTPQPRKDVVMRSLSDFRPELIEAFLVDYHSEPTCSRKDLADFLCVSERQLVRILEQLYQKSFRALLLERRMSFAEGWRTQHGLSAEATAEKVGYLTTSAFLEAYKRYFGKSFKVKT